MESKITITSLILISWLIWIHVAHAWFILLLYLILFATMLLDVALWFAVALKDKKLSSTKFTNWIIKKTTILLLIWVSILIVWWLSYYLHFEYILLLPHVFLWMFIIAEILSIIENVLLLDCVCENNYTNKVLIKIRDYLKTLFDIDFKKFIKK